MCPCSHLLEIVVISEPEPAGAPMIFAAPSALNCGDSESMPISRSVPLPAARA
jgi:hypothetical protein